MHNGREHMHRENASHASTDESNRLEHTSINDDPAQENAVEVAESIAESTEEADGLRPGSKLRALSKRQRAIVTVTFFSMFFGAGNLIFPPLLGAQAGNRTFIAMLGFIISAVGLPFSAFWSSPKPAVSAIWPHACRNGSRWCWASRSF